ncbi:MAG: class I SAM-dependent methyltransferase [Alphaproteobacteria bacterium]|nr:class I SAM-dependent methyltransferase [Alphaproteobacteria bacterium]
MRTIDFDTLHLSDKQTLLDVGCGRGRHTHAAYMFAQAHAIGIDLGFDDVKATRDGFTETLGAQDRYGALSGDALHLPFADASFDRLICSEVLEHIPDYYAAIAEMHRVVKIGGRIGISVPHRWTEQICWWLSRDYHNTTGGHIRIFKSHELIEDFETQGFRLYHKHLAHGLHTPYWWLRCALGVANDKPLLVRGYKKLLEIEIMKNPAILRPLSMLADRLCGKSIVLYFEKEQDA